MNAEYERVIKDALLDLGCTRDDLPMTAWHNPSTVDQTISIGVRGLPKKNADGETVAGSACEVVSVTCAPGATLRLPSLYDSAVQQICCHEKDCPKAKNQNGMQCRDPHHSGTIEGGQSSLLVNRSTKGTRTLAAGLRPPSRPKSTSKKVEN